MPKLNKKTAIGGVEVLIGILLLVHGYKTLKG